MKKTLAVLCALLICAGLAGCAGSGKALVDGTYHAEFADYDEYGYKDYIDVVIAGGIVVSFEADAISEADGSKKSESEDYRARMESISGSYPEKYYRDFANQYLSTGSADEIDIVAGATITTNSLIKLVRAVEQAARKGNTDPIIVER